MAEMLLPVTSRKEYCDMQIKIDVDEEVQYSEKSLNVSYFYLSHICMYIYKHIKGLENDHPRRLCTNNFYQDKSYFKLDLEGKVLILLNQTIKILKN